MYENPLPRNILSRGFVSLRPLCANFELLRYQRCLHWTSPPMQLSHFLLFDFLELRDGTFPVLFVCPLPSHTLG